MFSISCSFRQNLAKSYVSAPVWRVGAPSYGESWIRPCDTKDIIFIILVSSNADVTKGIVTLNGSVHMATAFLRHKNETVWTRLSVNITTFYHGTQFFPLPLQSCNRVQISFHDNTELCKKILAVVIAVAVWTSLKIYSQPRFMSRELLQELFSK